VACRTYRIIFAVAAAYNLTFGFWAIVFPHAFFRQFHLAQPRYPSIWACLGMVVGLYGFAYAYAAWKPDRGAVMIWIGLAGKVLGPAGWLVSVGRGELPAQTFPVILFNDLIWWFPFAFYLLKAIPQRRSIVTWVCVVIHLGACVGLLVVSGGTEAEPDMNKRMQWVSQWKSIWAAVWVIWILASMSLLAFCVVWSERLRELGASWSSLLMGCSICGTGLLCDLSGEFVNIVFLTMPGVSSDDFTHHARLYGILGPGIANGLYCIAGLVLSCVSWRVEFLRGPVAMLGFAMWLVGLALTVAAVIDHRTAMVVTGGGVMILFIPWATLVGLRLHCKE